MRTTNKALDDLITSKGYSFNEVAEMMGIDRVRLFQLRQKPYLMSVKQMEDISRITGASFEEVHNIHRQSRGEKA